MAESEVEVVDLTETVPVRAEKPAISPGPSPEKPPVDDYRIQSQRDYFKKRRFAYDVWSGMKPKELREKYELSKPTVYDWRRSDLVQRFIREYDRDFKAHNQGVQALVRAAEPEMLEQLYTIAQSTDTPPSVRVSVAQDWLDRGGSVPRVKDAPTVAPTLNITVEQLNLIGETAAQTLASGVSDVPRLIEQSFEDPD